MIEIQIGRKGSNAASRVGVWHTGIQVVCSSVCQQALLAVGCSAGQNCVWALHLYPGVYVDRRIGYFRFGLGHNTFVLTTTFFQMDDRMGMQPSCKGNRWSSGLFNGLKGFTIGQTTNTGVTALYILFYYLDRGLQIYRSRMYICISQLYPNISHLDLPFYQLH